MKKGILTIVLFILFSSCQNIWELSNLSNVKPFSTIKYDDTGQRKHPQLHCQGFYSWASDGNDGINNNVVFYEDGTCTFFSIDNKGAAITDSTHIEDIAYPIWENGHWGTKCGMYKIEGDGIEVEAYDKDLLFCSRWNITRFKFRINNGDALTLFYKECPNSDESLYFKWDMNDNYRFVHLNTQLPPSSDSFLRKQKWMWREK